MQLRWICIRCISHQHPSTSLFRHRMSEAMRTRFWHVSAKCRNTHTEHICWLTQIQIGYCVNMQAYSPKLGKWMWMITKGWHIVTPGKLLPKLSSACAYLTLTVRLFSLTFCHCGQACEWFFFWIAKGFCKSDDASQQPAGFSRRSLQIVIWDGFLRWI